MNQELNKSKNTKFLNIGEVKILKNPDDNVWTILGSCLTVIFHVPKRLSLICHAQMPSRSKYDTKCSDTCPNPCFIHPPDSLDFKHVTCSIDFMVNELIKNGVNLKKIHTTILGGASVLDITENNNSVGSQNIMMARKMLANYNITINRELVGGTKGLTLLYYSGTNKLIINKHPGAEKFELRDVKSPSFYV